MWPFSRSIKELRGGQVFLTNTLGGKKQSFIPLKPGQVTLYSCGPTVYSKQHIGNLKAPLFADLVARVLKANDFHVRRVINITDVGHLVSDADEGEDKMEVGARKENRSAEDIAAEYTRLFQDDLRSMNIDTNDIQFPHATQYIPEQIAMVKTLESQGHTYRIRDGIYFDVSTFPGYGKLGNIPQEFIKTGTAGDVADRVTLAGRGRIKENTEKRNPQDFALWKFSPAGSARQQEWSSPWGLGFPGWHIECSAMSKALLGAEIDIHTGGIDHIPVHHNNEIAQSESANGKPLARYWMHEAFVTIQDEKISKSLGNDIYLSDITNRGFHPLALRYFFLQAHYRTPLSFSWDALGASAEALNRLWKITRTIKEDSKGIAVYGDESERIRALAADDLGTPRVIAALWEIVRDDEISPKKIWGAIETAEAVLGLSLTKPPFAQIIQTPVPADVIQFAHEREAARQAQDYARADELRIHIENRGYTVEDSSSGPKIHSK
ncbi:MAG: cysteine--tRNA ligase [Parcubacteria group bacterium]|nr:cysteine--tRNA ligase [Parcubacteria group bacterium]